MSLRARGQGGQEPRGCGGVGEGVGGKSDTRQHVEPEAGGGEREQRLIPTADQQTPLEGRKVLAEPRHFLSEPGTSCLERLYTVAGLL